MRVSRERVAENRLLILDAASRLFREHGFDAVTVADVMKAAGLTHGGFYGYFESKDDLVAATLDHTFAASAAYPLELQAHVDRYLSARHRDNRAIGCPMAGLGSEVSRQAPQARHAMTEGLRRHLDTLTAAMPGDAPDAAREAAIGIWASMVGAMVLSRLVDDAALSDELLDSTRAWIGRQGAGYADAAAKMASCDALVDDEEKAPATRTTGGRSRSRGKTGSGA